MKVKVVGPQAPGSITLAYTMGGTAVEGINYTALTPSPVTIPAGQDEYELVFQVLNPGLFYKERELTLTLSSATNARVVASSNRSVYRLFIRTTADSPTVEFDLASSTTAYNGTIRANVLQDVLSLDDTTVYVRVADSSTADADDYTIASGTISAGSLQGNVLITWTGSAPGGSVTVVADIENDTRGAINLWSFSESLGTPEGPEFGESEATKPHATYPTDHLYKESNSQTEWSCEYPVPTEGLTPDGRASAYRFGLGPSAVATAKIGKTFTGTYTGTGTDAVDASNQLMSIPDDYWTFTCYVKVPSVEENKHDTFELTILDRLGNHTGSQVAHTATFARSGITLLASDSTNLDIAGDDSFSVMTGQAWDDSEESNGWHRVQMTYRGTTVANANKGITRSAGDVGNVTNRFINFWVGGSSDAPVERGQGWLIAWPQLEVASAATAYQRNAGHWGEPWGNARALSGGTLTHTFTVTPS